MCQLFDFLDIFGKIGMIFFMIFYCLNFHFNVKKSYFSCQKKKK